jgi:F-type H+-transporting ATPase subunit gamma
MASLRDVRLKIRSVKNISQITQAMKLVAAAKLRRVQERVEQGKPYSQTMAELVGMLAPNVREFEHPLLQEREVGAIGVVVISADKGLAGSYNSNLLRVAHQFIDRKTKELSDVDSGGREKIQIVTVGRKAGEYFTKRDYNVVQKYMSIGDKAGYDEVRAIADAVTGMFLSGKVDEVHVCFTEFINTITQRPQAIKFLPIEPPTGDGNLEMGDGNDKTQPPTPNSQPPQLEFIFEPAAPELLGVLLPRFVETRVYQLLLEAVASEFGARMTAMTNATKNAEEQIDDLTLLANRTRQAMITKELLDIVGGAEALNG